METEFNKRNPYQSMKWDKGTRNLVLFFLTFLFYELNAQHLEFKNYTTKDGLASDELYNLYQDSKGYIWIFSNHGTSKYNGSEFIPVLKNLDIKEGFVFSIAESTGGQKWIANSNAKIFEVRNDSAYQIKGFEQVSDSLRNSVSEIATLAVDDSLNLYAGTKGKSYKLKKIGEKYLPFCLSAKIGQDSILVRVKEVNKTLINIADHFENDEFVFKSVKKRQKKFLDIQLLRADRYIRMHYVNYSIPRDFKRFDKDIYFNFYKALVKITPDNQLKYIEMGSAILCYTRDRFNHIWVGCLNDGLYELNEQGIILNHYFENVTVNGVLADRQNGLWVSTSGRGLFHCLSLVNKVFSDKDPMGTELSFIKKIGENVFVANKVGDVYCFSKHGTKVIRKADKNQPLGIAKHQKHYVLTNTFSVDKFNLEEEAKSVQIIGVTEKQYNVFSKSEDTLIFVWRRGLNYYVGGKPRKKVDFGCKIISSELIGNTLWIGTENGAYFYKPEFKARSKRLDGVLLPDKERLMPSLKLDALKGSIISRVAADNRGNIWFCSVGEGLFRFSEGNIKHYNLSNGLPSDIINNIAFGPKNLILLCTNKGLFYTKYEDYLEKHLSWKLLYPGEVSSAEVLDSDIFISARSGLIKINFGELKNSYGKLDFNLASVKIDQNEISVASFKTLKSDHTNLEFKFDLIGALLDANEISYHLSGPIADSAILKGSVLKFSRLIPGKYVLSVIPIASENKKLAIVIPFEVIPSFAQTTIFKLILLILVLFLITLAATMIIRRNQRKHLVRAKNEQLIQEYKLIALRAQVNPHFMSNCLSAIQDLVMSENPEKATFYIAEFGLMVRQILDFSSRHLITLEEEINLLKIYLELEQLRFEKKFVYKIHIEKEIEPKSLHVPPLIFNPIVENAIWHGLLPVQHLREGELHIIIIKNKEDLVLTIQDNGAGRDSKKESISNRNGKSYGIKITEQRLTNLNYLYDLNNSRMIYTDLFDEVGKPSGTRVTIYVPANLNVLRDEED